MNAWKSIKLWMWYWATWRPAICCTCKRIYERGDFINPWGRDPGRGKGKRLACSYECADKANPGCVKELWP